MTTKRVSETAMGEMMMRIRMMMTMMMMMMSHGCYSQHSI